MSVAYEDIRLMPKGELTQELMRIEVHDDDHDDQWTGETGHEVEINDTETQGEGHNEHTEHVNATHNDGHDAYSALISITNDNVHAEKDIGDTHVETEHVTGEMVTDEQKVLSEIGDVIGNSQVTRKRLEFAPAWIVQKALQQEHENNWEMAYRYISEDIMPRNANVISSHVVYKVKTSEDGTMNLRARICPHGKRDDMKDDLRKDSTTAQFSVIRLLLSIATCSRVRLGLVYISGAYMQIGPIKRQIYGRPAREWDGGVRRSVWELLKMPYGITEAGIQWALVIESWLTDAMGMESIEGVSQIFIVETTAI